SRHACHRRRQMLRGGDQKQDVASRHFGEIVRGAYRGSERGGGEIERVGPARVDLADQLGLDRPKQHGPAVSGQHLGQRGTPRPGADDGYRRGAQAFTPAPRTGSASASSGQRGRAAMSSGSPFAPTASLSTPAQAIIAALSVHKAGGGATKRRPRLSASASSDCRTRALAATPPATTTAVTSPMRPSARLGRLT